MMNSISVSTKTVTSVTSAISMATVAAAAQPTLMQQQQQQLPITDPITVTSIFFTIKPLLVYPARWIAKLLLFLLRPLLYTLDWLAWPFISLANGLWSLITLPYILLLKFEAFLTFLLVAAVIGALTGSILYVTSSFTNKALGLEDSGQDREPVYQSKEDDSSRSVRSVADFRASRKAKKEKKKEKPVQSPREEKMFQDLLSKVDYGPSSDAGTQSRLSLSAQTILEEDDSSSFEQY